MPLQDLIAEIVSESAPEPASFQSLSEINRQRLTAAYLSENDSEISEVLLRLPAEYRKQIFSDMICGDPDLHDFQKMFRNTAIGFFADYIDGEIDDYERDFYMDNGMERVA